MPASQACHRGCALDEGQYFIPWKKLGYHMVGEFHQCGYKFDTWYNMVWMEKMIGEHKGSTAAGNLVLAAARSVTEFMGRTIRCLSMAKKKCSFGIIFVAAVLSHLLLEKLRQLIGCRFLRHHTKSEFHHQ